MPTEDEVRTMLTLWCIFGSPLMIGSELPLLDDTTVSILTDPVLMKIHSCDFESKEEVLSDDEAVWSTVNPKTGEKYIALFNLSDKKRTVTFEGHSAELNAHACTVVS